MSDKRRGDDDRRMTKAERRDEARRQRIEIQRQMARRRKNRTIVVALAIGLAGVIVAVVAFSGSGGGLPAPADLLARAKDAAQAASCTEVQTIPPFDPANVTGDPSAIPPDANIDGDHVGSTYDPTDPPLSAYPSVPPTSGPHAPTGTPGPLPAGMYEAPPDVYRAIHSLEHGGTIVWYSPTASGEQLQQLKDFYGQRLIDEAVGQDRVIVAPYDYPEQDRAGRLPDGVQMALVAWHRLETCVQVNLAAAFDFTSQYSAPQYAGRTYLGEAPEAGGRF